MELNYKLLEQIINIDSPTGYCNKVINFLENVIKDLGYINVMWSSAYDDWDKNKQGRTEYGKKKILDNLHNGAIILLHSTSEDNMNMLDELLKEIKNSGYEIKSLNEFEK